MTIPFSSPWSVSSVSISNPGGDERHGIEVTSVQDAKPGQDVLKPRAEDEVDDAEDQMVAETPEVVERLSGGALQAIADDHVGLVREDRREERVHVLGEVRVVAVDDDERVGR